MKMEMANFLASFVLLLAIFAQSHQIISAQTFNVVNYGAVGNGATEDTQAFINAWEATCKCNSSSSPTMVVPGGKSFLLQPFTFDGRGCKSTNIRIVMDGELIAPEGPSAWKYKGKACRQWILFEHMKGLKIQGSGTINGRGSTWWRLSCTQNKRVCGNKPTGFILEHSERVQIKGLTFKDSPQMHMAFVRSRNVHANNLRIQAPANSRNTDGIHVQNSQKIFIRDSHIGTGDDCISIGDGSSKISISNISCGPGHGISIGSLGKHGQRETVQHIHVKDVTFTGTTNGARIKTWQGGRGYAKHIIFEGITSRGSSNPIVINQFYCDHEQCKNQTSAVKISHVLYRKISGTSGSEIAVNLACSDSIPCRNIVMKDIDLRPTGRDGTRSTSSFCGNVVHGLQNGTIIPSVPCLNQIR